MTTRPDSYSEKLWPAWWIWTAGTLIGASVSLMFFPIDAVFGFLAMAVGVALVLFALVVTTPRLTVTGDSLTVGRAQIGTEHLGHVVAHRGDAAREQLGPGLDARSYRCIRGWVDPVVTAEITDPQDETPYWLFSVRRPERVLAVLGSTEPVREQGTSITG
ncbi:DUF3093 domain-containing protein [Nesterenkonia marinintestina]|uniref:DUF3093 domain-containing protein n=1 Tax=Nesterenkonia marinintestina TaxID=2979865 RepID=UPI0021C08E16|nr:DUF3093 domain-containing protein [Nesterenkonia sp. GX14115]